MRNEVAAKENEFYLIETTNSDVCQQINFLKSKTKLNVTIYYKPHSQKDSYKAFGLH